MLLDKVKDTIEQHALFSQGASVVLGVSGGPDSVCLFHLFRELMPEYDLHVSVAHLNHNLRGEEAQKDSDFVEGLCWQYSMPYYSDSADIVTVARNSRLSLEEAARTVRYDFFENVARNAGASTIAVGHSADDQVETVLMRLIRGAGSRGLGSIPYRRTATGITVIRPLRAVWRSEILEYLQEQGIAYRIDSSNENQRFLRNRIRTELIPLLASHYNPAIKNVIFRTGEILRAERDVLDELSRSASSDVFSRLGEKLVIDLHRFKKYHLALQRELLRSMLEQCTDSSFSFRDIEVIRRFIFRSRSGQRLSLRESVRIVREYDLLTVSAQASASSRTFQITLPVPGTIREPQGCLLVDTSITDNQQEWKTSLRQTHTHDMMLYWTWDGITRKISFVEYMDYDKIAPPLILRSRKAGDKYRPIGLDGQKKLKDLFIDAKVPSSLRNLVPVLVSGNGIAWVAGYRIAESVKINRSTKRVLRMSITRSAPMRDTRCVAYDTGSTLRDIPEQEQ